MYHNTSGDWKKPIEKPFICYDYQG